MFGLTTNGDVPPRVHLIKLSGKLGVAQGDENAYDS